MNNHVDELIKSQVVNYPWSLPTFIFLPSLKAFPVLSIFQDQYFIVNIIIIIKIIIYFLKWMLGIAWVETKKVTRREKKRQIRRDYGSHLFKKSFP